METLQGIDKLVEAQMLVSRNTDEHMLSHSVMSESFQSHGL